MGLMKIEKYIIAIPARLNSSRLPNKILKDIGGVPMLKRVLDICKKSFGKVKVIACVDDIEVKNLVENWGYNSILTSKECDSGTDRISSVVDKIVKYAWEDNNSNSSFDLYSERLKKTLIINVQADQPFLDYKVINKLVDYFIKNEQNTHVITPIYPLKSFEIANPNIVKTLINLEGRAIYFSRQVIPYIRDVDPKKWHEITTFWGHVGIYGYRADVIASWSKYNSKLENLEKLEQLRFIEKGFNIDTIAVDGNFLSVDNYEQLKEANDIAKIKS